MFDFLLGGAFAPFSFALALLFGLMGLELVALLLGGSLMTGDNDVAPDIGDAPDLGDFDLDLDLDPEGMLVDPGDLELAEFDAEIDVEGGIEASSGLASWLGLGKMPTLIWLAALLMGFGLSGLGLQVALQELFGLLAPAWLAALPAGAFGLWFARGFGGVFARLLPQTETEASSMDQLGRRRGVITQGTATRGRAAEVRVNDRFGNAHHLRAEPLRDDETLEQGAEVLVLRDRRSGTYVLVGLSD
ncbi:OB-fold-containig protein [Parasedimentitalea huanghaiensis]|uniref:DUF1449 family protein n=1 Tax=Parasedimentitalea huanghaiensis TaxID=2682100 RepID=A0A6L6WGE0_9RHOB|nr:OB-fold-containig protein [Zongyanglinia huanghaiensis]MVO15665.1 DUF1449 family protein [Zongyanglinia huanghaiensis]